MGWSTPGSATSMNKVLRVYLYLLSAEGLVALVFLLTIPADPKNAVLFGFSPLRLVLLGISLVLIGIFLSLTVWIRRYPNRLARTSTIIGNLIRSYWIFWLLVISLSLSFILSTFLLF